MGSRALGPEEVLPTVSSRNAFGGVDDRAGVQGWIEEVGGLYLVQCLNKFRSAARSLLAALTTRQPANKCADSLR
jgi:hypothetical protein